MPTTLSLGQSFSFCSIDYPNGLQFNVITDIAEFLVGNTVPYYLILLVWVNKVKTEVHLDDYVVEANK